jgi:hypothetical protein
VKRLPPFELVARRLAYDPSTGRMTWLTGQDAGKPAGSRHPRNGSLYFSIEGVRYLAHRIAWLLHTGKDPYPLVIDHRNGDPSDNSAGNLRATSQAVNVINTRARGRWPKGVYRARSGSFVAQTKLRGVVHYLGTYATPEQAHAAYREGVAKLHGADAYLRG